MEKRVLVIDDNVAYCKVVEELLSRQGCQVKSCSDPEEALRMACSEPFELILLDLNMPGVDGFDMKKVLSENEKTRGVPVVIISGCSSDEIKKRDPGLLMGSYGFIQKPFIDDELVEVISSVLDKTT